MPGLRIRLWVLLVGRAQLALLSVGTVSKIRPTDIHTGSANLRWPCFAGGGDASLQHCLTRGRDGNKLAPAALVAASLACSVS